MDRKLSRASPARSRTKAACRSRDTGPELVLRGLLDRLGIGYAAYAAGLPGTPDLVVPGLGFAVFVHGCFWHAHRPCAKYLPPLSNRAYWRGKARANAARDGRALGGLRSLGWRPLVVWECRMAERDALYVSLAPLLRAAGVEGAPSPLAAAVASARFILRSAAAQLRRRARRAFRRAAAAMRALRPRLKSSPSSPFIDPGAELRADEYPAPDLPPSR